MFRLLWNERLTLFELVRALHNSGIQRHCLSRSLKQYAVRSPETNEPRFRSSFLATLCKVLAQEVTVSC